MKSHSTLLPLSFRERGLFETSGMAELRSLQTATLRKYWRGFWKKLGIGLMVAIVFAAAMIFCS